MLNSIVFLKMCPLYKLRNEYTGGETPGLIVKKMVKALDFEVREI